MRQRNSAKLAVLVGAVLCATAEALAFEQQNAAGEKAPGEEQESRRRIVISIADRKLALIEDSGVVKIYPIAVGAEDTPSPTGNFKIISRVRNPTWYGPHHQIVPPGKANPLGTRWMGLSRKGYGIHGTNAPLSIGHNVSHGCIRMRKADVEELFKLVEIGDEVAMISRADTETAWIFGLEPESADSGE